MQFVHAHIYIHACSYLCHQGHLLHPGWMVVQLRSIPPAWTRSLLLLLVVATVVLDRWFAGQFGCACCLPTVADNWTATDHAQPTPQNPEGRQWRQRWSA